MMTLAMTINHIKKTGDKHNWGAEVQWQCISEISSSFAMY